MATLRAVLGDEVEVISRDAKGARIARRPDAHERALDRVEMEFRLSLGRGEKPRAFAGSLHCARMHALKSAIHAQGIEEIFGFTVRIPGTLYITETPNTPHLKLPARPKSPSN